MLGFNTISSEYLNPVSEEQRARKLFGRAVKMVEIETFSYCNRVCWFCPNKDGSRLGANRLMDIDLYRSILEQLASIDYSNKISYSRYNEPLADRVILDRIKTARSFLPRACLHTNTNGDYLDADYLEELKKAGLNQISIQIYLKNDEKYDDSKMRKKADMILRKLGVPFAKVVDKPGRRLEYNLDFEGMKVRLYGRNFEVNGTSRGGTVDIGRDYVRFAPCLQPLEAVYIDYNGSMMPCCNLRSDIAAHSKTRIATLSPDSSLFLAYSSKVHAEWRKGLVSFGEKKGVCRDCRHSLKSPALKPVNSTSSLGLKAYHAVSSVVRSYL